MEPDEKYGQLWPENVAGAGIQTWTTEIDDEGGVAEIEWEAVLDLMRRLEEEISGGGEGGAASWGCPFITINGNEESCGPSFSDTSTTVMASFDLTTGVPALGLGGGMVECEPMEAGIDESWLVQAEGVFWPSGNGGRMDPSPGGAGEESEEEWLDRVLNSGGFGFEFEALEE